MPKMINGSQKEPQHPYGYCKICQSPVDIPGLTDSKCPKHGWISTAFSVTSQIQKQAAKTYQQKQPAVLPQEKSSRSNSSRSTSIQPPHSERQPTAQASPVTKSIQPTDQDTGMKLTQLDLWGGTA